jgi:hypothetical protein
LTNIEAVRAQQAQTALTIEEELAGFEAQIVELRTRLVSLETILKDEETIEALGSKLNGLIDERNALKEKKRALGLINGQEEVTEFYDTIGNVKALFYKRTLEQQQKLFGLLTDRVEIVPISPHWLRITIHWIGSMFNRPDVCLLWRQNGARGPLLKQWELDLIRQQYPTCKRYTDLLMLLPNRTWAGIRKIVRDTLNIRKPFNVNRCIADFPINACWADIMALPKYERTEALKMVREAAGKCDRRIVTVFPFWLLPASTLGIDYEHIESYVGNPDDTHDRGDPGQPGL